MCKLLFDIRSYKNTRQYILIKLKLPSGFYFIRVSYQTPARMCLFPISAICPTHPSILLHLTNRIIAMRYNASIIVARCVLAELRQTMYKLAHCSEMYIMQASRRTEMISSSTVLGQVQILELENSGYHAIVDCQLQTVFIWLRTGTSGGPL